MSGTVPYYTRPALEYTTASRDNLLTVLGGA